MKAAYRNTVEQIANFNLYTFIRSPHFKRNILNGRMFVLVYVILLVIYSCVKLEFTDRVIIIGAFVIFGVLWFFLFPRFYTKSIKGEVYSKYRHGRLYLDDVCVEVDSDCVNAVFTRDGQVQKTLRLTDNDISAIIYTDEAVYIVGSDEQQSLVVPYSCFEQSETDKQEFVALLNETFPQKISQSRAAS